MRRRQCATLAAIAFLVFAVYSIIQLSHARTKAAIGARRLPLPIKRPRPREGSAARVSTTDAAPDSSPPQEQAPHPISKLVQDARQTFDSLTRRQSRSLEEAVAEYRRRYGIPPPPHFDKWLDFAMSNDVQLLDEFDTIYDFLTPFWGLKPQTIRARAREALGFDNALLGVAVRDHQLGYMQGGQEWQRNALKGLLKNFLPYLPDMDLAFNIHDEPRVMLPHEDLARLVARAKTRTMPAANANQRPVNDFTRSCSDLSRGRAFGEIKRTRFNVFAHQPTWTHSRMSCPPDSPARLLDEGEPKREEEEEEEDGGGDEDEDEDKDSADGAPEDANQNRARLQSAQADAWTKYAVGELGFVYNTTAMTDICLSPSLRSQHGFFDRPNAYSVVQDLFPIFSQSKLSSYSDIIYPSPWDWSGKVAYQEDKDPPWARKLGRLYWRGSTTGGFSRSGGWRRQHRQRFVRKINARDRAPILVETPAARRKPAHAGPPGGYQVRRVPRGSLRQLIDVHFSHVGQCDPGDCQAQKSFFQLKERADQQEAWTYKFLLDMDGNAFSGRFLAFLRSRSLPFKMALFREWHADWLRPWVHYVPLSFRGDDWLEAVRFFAGPGQAEAERMALAGRQWAGRALRRVDMEAWFFRLLLEYARVIDDQRESLGFDPASADRKLRQQPARREQPS